MNIKKLFWILLGFMGVGIGAVGAVVPILPTIPFLMLATISFAKSSEKLHTWFMNTTLYKDNLQDFVDGHGMTWKTKVRIVSVITVLMSIGLLMMSKKGVMIGCIVLCFVWFFHVLYFFFGVKTLPVKEVIR